MQTDTDQDATEDPRDAEEIYRDVADEHDPVTTREAFEQEVAEEGRSAEAEDVGEHVD